MTHIGLIVGIGPAAGDHYNRLLIRQFADAGLPLDLTMVHADAPTLLANLAADRSAAQAEIFAQLTERLARAGAGFVAVTSIAGHFCRQAFAARSVLPVIDMVDTVAADIAGRRFGTLGILGTRTVMASGLYGGIATATVLAPAGEDLHAVHTAYAAMATAGRVTPEQATVFNAAAARLIERGAEAILLGGTDLALVFDAATSPLPVIDCAAIHVQAIAATAMADGLAAPPT